MIWAPIQGFPKYAVSQCGKVANIKDYKPLAVSLQRKGFTTYERVTLFKKGKRYYKSVHRLVAEAFVPNPHNLPQVDHLDTNGQNNHKENLEWCTGSQNVQRAFARNRKNKLTICSTGGAQATLTTRARSEAVYKAMLGERFVKFHPSGEVHRDAAVSYVCSCGLPRTAAITGRELRVHKGLCPLFNGSTKTPSLL